MRNEGYLSPQNTDEGVFLFLFCTKTIKYICAYFDNINFVIPSGHLTLEQHRKLVEIGS